MGIVLMSNLASPLRTIHDRRLIAIAKVAISGHRWYSGGRRCGVVGVNSAVE
jgi:hypothetical protein